MPRDDPDPRTAEVKRELLVRQAQAWVPAALHRARRAVYVHGDADADDGQTAEAAVRVFAEQADLARGRELAVVAIAQDAAVVGERLAGAGLGGGPGALQVHTVTGGTDDRLPAAVRAIGAIRVPVLAFVDTTVVGTPPALATLAAVAQGRPADVLLVLAADVLPGLAQAAAGGAVDAAVARSASPLDPAVGDRFFGGDGWRAAAIGVPAALRIARLADAYRAALREVGFPLVTMVELATAEDPGELLVFATTSGRSLEGFKEALWAADEFAGVRYRDPGDPERHLIDISLNPHPGPLRRELLRHLGEAGPRTVTQLKTFALTETVYRAADATRALGSLLSAGAVTRDPEHGRLGGDVVISASAG